jgi:peroxiredoxin
MAQLEPMKSELEGTGAQLILIAAEKRDGMFKPAKFLEKHPVSFPFLLDEDRTVTKAYGLYHWLATDAINIAHPATLVIDRDGTVRYIYRGDNQMDRAPLEQVLAAVKKLSISS